MGDWGIRRRNSCGRARCSGPQRSCCGLCVRLRIPSLPQTTGKIWTLLGQNGTVAEVPLDGLRWGQLAPSTQLGKAQTLFPRVDKTEAVERIEAMANEELNPTAPPARTCTGERTGSRSGRGSARASGNRPDRD